MSGLPPTIDAETGTPAHEWAQSTTTAAFAREDPAPAADSSIPPGVQNTASTVSTPGLEFPGAYPSESGVLNTQAIADAAKHAMNSVTTTAQQYIPVAQETAAQAAQAAAAAASQATQTAQSYLSGTSTTAGSTVRASIADNEHQTSLPSSETTGALPQEHVGGIGALPGSVQEEAVTKLPDDRSVKGDSAIYPTTINPSTAPPDVLSPASQESSAISPIAATAIPATTAFTALAPSGQQPTHPQDTAVTLRESLPSQELTGQAPYTHQDGAGALPGLKREQGVAVLPDESRGPAGTTAATSSATGTHPRDWSANPAIARPGEEPGNESLGLGERRVGKDAAGGVGSLVGAKGEEGVAVLPDERGATSGGVAESTKGDKLCEMDQAEREERDRMASTHKSQQRRAGQNEGGAHDTDYHPAELHPLPANMEGTQAHTTVKGDETKEDSVESGQGPSGHAEGGEKAKRASFMEKMKGEAKVMMGKLEGKKGADKVQEGRRLKAGEA